ncbi:MAG: TadE/TadG family type IV pilus assembly protein [Rudaea sp.]
MLDICQKESRAASGDGQSLIEFGLALPFLLFIIFGVLDLGFAVYAQNTIALAAREGTRTGIVYRGSDAATRAAICSKVVESAQALNLTCAANVTIQPSTITHEQPVTVTVVYTYNPVTPLVGSIIGSGGFPLESSSTMTVE